MTRKRGETSIDTTGMDLPASVSWHAPMSRAFHALAWEACEKQGFTSFAGFIRDCVADRISAELGIPKDEVLALTPSVGNKFWLQRQNLLRKPGTGVFIKLDEDDDAEMLP